jgi:hypothetical protein
MVYICIFSNKFDLNQATSVSHTFKAKVTTLLILKLSYNKEYSPDQPQSQSACHTGVNVIKLFSFITDAAEYVSWSVSLLQTLLA